MKVIKYCKDNKDIVPISKVKSISVYFHPLKMSIERNTMNSKVFCWDGFCLNIIADFYDKDVNGHIMDIELYGKNDVTKDSDNRLIFHGVVTLEPGEYELAKCQAFICAVADFFVELSCSAEEGRYSYTFRDEVSV